MWYRMCVWEAARLWGGLQKAVLGPQAAGAVWQLSHQVVLCIEVLLELPLGSAWGWGREPRNTTGLFSRYGSLPPILLPSCWPAGHLTGHWEPDPVLRAGVRPEGVPLLSELGEGLPTPRHPSPTHLGLGTALIPVLLQCCAMVASHQPLQLSLPPTPYLTWKGSPFLSILGRQKSPFR